jgi:cytochrome c
MRSRSVAALALVALATPALAQTEPPSLARGEALWAKCQACHSIVPNGRNLVGPALYGVFGRMAGTLPGYRYSDAMKNSGMVWTEENLDRYLAATQEVIPGSKMYGGLAVDQDRVDLLAWMKQVAGAAKP